MTMVTQTFERNDSHTGSATVDTVSLLSLYLPLSGPFVQAFHSLDIPLILHFPLFVPQLIEQLSNIPKYLR